MGPNAVLAFAREGYRRRTMNGRELLSAVRFPGFGRLVVKHWRHGLGESLRDVSRTRLLKDLRRYVPELRLGDLMPGPSGVRAQALAADGTLVDDFVFDTSGTRVLNVRNAPSPAATCALGIAGHIADRWSELATG
jgi:L-2-hydroxyglutarate oxidase LhgO